MTVHFLGIDPGLSGCFVLLDEAARLVLVKRMPRVQGSKGPLDLREVDRFLRECATWQGGTCFAAYEEVQHAGGGGARRPGVRSLLTAGRNHGRIEGMLVSHSIRYELVTPSRWQKPMHVGCGEGKDTKARSVMACRRLLPGLDLTPGRKTKPDDNIADAGLLALYARRVWGQR